MTDGQTKDIECSRSKISNHSARKTSITTLLNNNVHPMHVSQLSGHKNIESLKSYHTASSKQKRNMSDIINNNKQQQKQQEQQSSNDKVNSQFISTSTVSLSQGILPRIFHGASLHNSTFNFNDYQQEKKTEPPLKRRMIILDSSDDEE